MNEIDTQIDVVAKRSYITRFSHNVVSATWFLTRYTSKAQHARNTDVFTVLG